MKKGVWFAIAAYLMWGTFPIYWKWLHQVPALELIGHRIAWSFVFVSIILFITRQWKSFRKTAINRRGVLVYLASAIFLAVNWLTYVWAVNAGYIVESSLGYFINPLFSVLLGVVFLHERLRPWQWMLLGLAAVGVVYVAFSYGKFPWIALTLASSFGIYGLIKKTAPLGSLYGLTLETGLLFIPAVGYLLYLQIAGQGAFLNSGAVTNGLLVGAGVITAIPLLLFASAAQRIPLSMVGILQYITPTMQFLLGVLVYREPFNQSHLVGFCIVWAALLLFWAEGVLIRRKQMVQIGN
jgi:chloramphenicol-sensitive protein RarD